MNSKFPKDDPKSPGTRSMAFDAMTPVWDKVEAVLGGTSNLRAAGPKYLPIHAEERDLSYRERLGNNVLLNLTELTLDSWVGRPFRDPVTREDDIPEDVAVLLDDVDLLGNDITVFSRNWFRDGVAKALSHVFVDFRRGLDFSDRTLADDNREGIRPFLMHVHPERILFAHSEIIDGKEKLTHLRWKEDVVEQVGFAEVVKERIRVFDLVEVFENDGENEGVSKDIKTRVEVTLYEWRERSSKNRKVRPSWVKISSDFMDIDEIPLITFYANRDGFMTGKPPISDLCDLNIRWWQSNSDQIAILTVSRFPILAASGISDTEELVIGPNSWLGMEAANGKFYYVEHKGAAIDAGRRDLLDLEEQMGNYGADFLKKRPGNATATARALDAAESTSPLQDVAVRFEDALENVVRLMNKWNLIARGDSSEPVGGTLSVITEYGPEEVEQVHASLMTFARKNNDLSREAFLKQLQEFGALPPGFDMAANDRQLEEEGVSEMNRMIEADNLIDDEPDNIDDTDNKTKP